MFNKSSKQLCTRNKCNHILLSPHLYLKTGTSTCIRAQKFLSTTPFLSLSRTRFFIMWSQKPLIICCEIKWWRSRPNIVLSFWNLRSIQNVNRDSSITLIEILNISADILQFQSKMPILTLSRIIFKWITIETLQSFCHIIKKLKG